MPTLAEWRAIYDGWAGSDPRLASTGHIVPDEDFARLGATLAEWLQLRGDERVLDVGCASGTLTSQWAHRARNVVGIDFSERLAAEAERRHGNDRLRFASAEAAALPFESGSFDCVVCFNVLLSLPDHAYAMRAVGELGRVVRPGGKILLGSLPDERCQVRFFELLQGHQPWPRRVLGKLKNRLRPRETKILWFDVGGLRREFERAGWQVELHDDPPFANYRHYRKTLVLRRPEGIGS